MDSDGWLLVGAPASPRQRVGEAESTGKMMVLDEATSQRGPAPTLMQRLSLVSMAATPRHVQESDGDRAGQRGEDLIAEKVSGDGVFRSIRVPELDSAGRYKRRHEIDICVVANDGLCLIEVKNWAGELTAEEGGSKWRHVRRYERGTIIHDNVVDVLRHKAECLKEYLLRNGVSLPEDGREIISCAVVFAGSNLQIAPEIAELPEVVPVDKSEEFLAAFDSGSTLMALAKRYLPLWLTGAVLNPLDLVAVKRLVGVLPTFDFLEIEGGKRLVGDFKALEGLSGADLDRAKVCEVVLQHDRARVMGTLWALAGYAPTVAVTTILRPGLVGTGGIGSWFVTGDPVYQLPIDAKVTFRCAGDTTDTLLPLNDVKCIRLSRYLGASLAELPRH